MCEHILHLCLDGANFFLV